VNLIDLRLGELGALIVWQVPGDSVLIQKIDIDSDMLYNVIRNLYPPCSHYRRNQAQ